MTVFSDAVHDASDVAVGFFLRPTSLIIVLLVVLSHIAFQHVLQRLTSFLVLAAKMQCVCDESVRDSDGSLISGKSGTAGKSIRNCFATKRSPMLK
jgi:hypothetical protein